MLKKNSKLMSVVLAIVFCLSFMAPAFVTPDVAQAAATYRALSAPPFEANAINQDFGIIEVDIPTGAEIKANDILSISFPSNVTSSDLPGLNVYVDDTTSSPNNISVIIPANHPQTGQPNGLAACFTGVPTGTPATNASFKVGGTMQSIDITFASAGTFERGVLYIYLNEMDLNGASGDLTATLMGNTNALPMGQVVVGKVSSVKGTAAAIKSVTPMGTASTAIDTFTLIETQKNSLVSGEVVKLKLPVGFKWNIAGIAVPNWAFAAASTTVTPSVDADNRILNITLGNTGEPNNTTTGRFDLAGAQIKADDSVAKKGDVTVQVYSDQGNVTSQELVVAKYGEYAAKGVEGTVNELIAGKSEQKLGTFYIEEELPGSLVKDRIIKMTLPEGVKWWAGYRNSSTFPQLKVEAGNLVVNNFTVGTDSNNSSDTVRSISTTINTQGAGKVAGKVKFKDFKVDVSPEFKGDIVVTISGAAGATGEVKVATVIPAVELSVENKKDVKIGSQKQVTGDLIITETKKENIAFRNNDEYVEGKAGIQTAATNNVPLTLVVPAGARWADLPKVEVIEGDVQLDLAAMSKGNVAAGDGRLVTIPVKSSSLKASKIKVSDILVTLDRTVPEGDFKISVGGLSVNEVPNVFPNAGLPGQIVANCVTPAPDEGTVGAVAGEFRVDSNIYYSNGVAKVMDTAAYIKNGRTYVPMRVLGEAILGAEVIWDAAARTVTLIKGDTEVVFTINSTTYTVNGESKTNDVAPEIVNDRTMLPARAVAEAFGANVGWDPVSKTVLISK